MQSDLKSVLWADLTEVQACMDKTMATLHALQRAIENGTIDQPSRQDSDRLNRLMVLAELLCNESNPWNEELGLTRQPANGNGHTTATPARNGRNGNGRGLPA